VGLDLKHLSTAGSRRFSESCGSSLRFFKILERFIKNPQGLLIFTKENPKIRQNSPRFSKKHPRMRNTRHSVTGREGNEALTLQQVMRVMQGLQEAMAASRAEQERIQVDLAASQARNEELHRTN